MTASRKKGTAFETAVVDYLRAHGHPYAERRAVRGVRDAGDIAGVIGWCLEVKNHRELSLGEWAGEAQREAVNGRCYRWAVIHKRRQKNVRDAYVTLPLWLFAALLADDVEPAGEVAG